jgi:short subunit dehydrogenase-like uncharacterized protein
VYGAGGVTGRRIVETAVRLGLRPIVAGRTAERVAAVAGALELPWRVAAPTVAGSLEEALDGVRVVLNAAGPFADTAAPLVEACLRRGVDYLDVAGEPTVIEAIARRHADARRAGVMLLPAVGFEVVAGDCLVAHLLRRLPGALRLHVGVTPPAELSPGSLRTLVRYAGLGLARRAGRLQRLPLGTETHALDFGEGPQAALNVSLPDVATAYYTTGVPDVTGWLQATPLVRATLAWARMAGWAMRGPAAVMLTPLGRASGLTPGPGSPHATSRMTVVAEAEAARGCRVVARLRTPDPYTTTASAAAAVLARVVAGARCAGFQTPARLFGPGLVLGLPGVVREDLA